MTLADLRREYTLAGLRRADLDPDPIAQFQKWFTQAMQAEIVEPNAMTLATVSAEGQPSTRIVLLKGVDQRGFSFFTNYESRKGRELAANPKAALTFFWGGLERQVSVCGSVEKLPRAESEAYFAVRPLGSQRGAWVSKQSRLVENREFLEKRLAEVEKQYGTKVPTPPYWGGYVLNPTSVEFWQGRPNRLHDRFLYRKSGSQVWSIERLSP
ncbi:MAG TPA: pyridoxamine 5'-phosphate oxidase [Verrucomicrobiae bacterium]